MANNALPIILIGGAAALMLAGGKKKKTSAPSFGELKLEPTTPPPLPKAVKTSGSGYPGVTRERMQEIQTMLVANGYDVGKYGLDGKYGPATKQAVWEFQEDWGGLVVDGKPGSKTQTALEEAEAERLKAQQRIAQQHPEKKAQVVDQCDPLDPRTWGSGNVCVFDGVRWAKRTAKVKPQATQCTPANEQRIIIPTNLRDRNAWKFCDFGTVYLLKDYIPSNMAFSWHKYKGVFVPSFYGDRYNEMGDTRNEDWVPPMYIEHKGYPDSKMVGRLVAIVRKLAIANPNVGIRLTLYPTMTTSNVNVMYYKRYEPGRCGHRDKWLELDGQFSENLNALMQEHQVCLKLR